jgi:Na+/proline symporter
LLYGLLAVFLFSRLWRRANVLTENELLELRYSGTPAAFLRVFKAGYFALLYNLIVMGWVIKGMSSVLAVMLGDETRLIDPDIMIYSLVVIASAYALLSGFWGVVITDVVQFVIAMVGAIWLAVIAVQHVGGIDSLMIKLDQSLAQQHATMQQELDEIRQQLDSVVADPAAAAELAADASALEAKLAQLPRSAQQAIHVVPPMPRNQSCWSAEYLNSPFFQFVVLVTVMWWSNHATDGGGYLIQRTMAAKDEHHALAANLWYNFANFALRTWPWILVALVSIVMFPDLRGHELGEKAGYPLVMQSLLGSGLRGLLVVSFLAAFMSTIDTHLNWGSSYLVHDIYRRFLVPDQSERHYVLIGRIVTVALMVAAAALSREMGSIEKAWKFVMAMGGGIGLVLILRWFWWRINAWTEIAALATSVAVTVGFEVLAAQQTVAAGKAYALFGTDPTVFEMPFPFHLQLLVIVGASVAVWLVVTFITRPEPEATLREFYLRVQPGGWWGQIGATVPMTKVPVARGFVWNFIAGLCFVWGGMFFVGYMIFKQWQLAALMLALMMGGFAWIYQNCLRPGSKESP